MSEPARVPAERILEAGPEAMPTVHALFLEYAESLGFSLCFQGFDQELAGLPGDYARPDGRLLLALVGDEIAGIVGLRPYAPGVCEMKRLYVRPAFRGTGLGRRLARQILAEARIVGYESMRLDTVRETMLAAQDLYRSLGFVELPASDEDTLIELAFFQFRLR